MSDYETMTISEFKATCLRVIEQVRRTGKQLLITKNGEVAALVSPPPHQASNKKSYRGVCKGKIKIVGDIVSPVKVVWDALRE